MQVSVVSGLPGCGKTSLILDEIASAPGRYLFAMPRTDLIDERVRDLEGRTSTAGSGLVVVPIHSDQKARGPVKRRIRDAAGVYSDDAHVVVLITHEALTTTDLSGYYGWHVRIDETPDAVASDLLRIPVAAQWFKALYDLRQVPGTKWARVEPRDTAPAVSQFMKDDFAEELLGFHKRAISPTGVVVDVTEWDQAFDTTRPVRWWSAWSPRDLQDFATVKIAASGYYTSLCHLATEAWYPGEVTYETHEIETTRTRPPQVRVHYYTRGHRGSTSFWKDGQGKECLTKVGRHLATVRGLGFWSGNKLVRERFELALPGLSVSPKLAGTNSLRHLTSCALIFSNKAQDSDAPILEVFGLDKSHIEHAREVEDVQQFVMRGRIRCPDYAGQYDVYVYDDWQAEAVRDFLVANAITDVELTPLTEVGIMDEVRPKAGRKAVELDVQTKAQRDHEKRVRDAARKREARACQRENKKRAGTYRGAGRPSKQPPNEGAVFS